MRSERAEAVVAYEWEGPYNQQEPIRETEVKGRRPELHG